MDYIKSQQEYSLSCTNTLLLFASRLFKDAVLTTHVTLCLMIGWADQEEVTSPRNELRTAIKEVNWARFDPGMFVSWSTRSNPNILQIQFTFRHPLFQNYYFAMQFAAKKHYKHRHVWLSVRIE